MSPAVRVSPDDRQAFRVVATKSSPDMKFGVVCRSEDGVVTIMALEEESILYKCGLLEGDEVLYVNGTAVTHCREVTDLLKAAPAPSDVVVVVRGMPSDERRTSGSQLQVL